MASFLENSIEQQGEKAVLNQVEGSFGGNSNSNSNSNSGSSNSNSGSGSGGAENEFVDDGVNQVRERITGDSNLSSSDEQQDQEVASAIESGIQRFE